MTSETTISSSPEPNKTTDRPAWLSWLFVAGLVYLLLVAVSLIGGGFKLSAGESAKELFEFASNPITALVIGTVATALIQSSSTVTSIIVGLVAGGLPVSIAIPMVMGANIGTTITNTIVSIGHIKTGEEFRRAFSAATIHDFFNLMCVVIFLPLEIAFGLLDKIGDVLTGFLINTDSVSVAGGFNPVKKAVGPPVDFVNQSLSSLLPELATGLMMIGLGVVCIFLSITFIGKILRVIMVGRAKAILHAAVGRGPVSGITSGAVMTVLVQSSSTTTSLIVPLAGAGIFNLRQVYPFTLGANIGTCITGLLAAIGLTEGDPVVALKIALVHLCYNVLGVIVVYGIPFLREIPITASEMLADLAIKNRLYVAAYVAIVFFVVPALLIIGTKALSI